MNYRGTIAYRCGLGGHIPEGFLASVVPAWDFLLRQSANGGVPVTDIEIKVLANQFQDNPIQFLRGLSCMPHDAANQIADTFSGDWVMMLDTDHVFQSDTFLEMVQTFEQNNLDILVGFTQKRQAPYLPVIMKTNFDPLKRFVTIIPKGIDRQRLIPIDASGLACTMIHRRVFDSIKTKLDEKPFDFRRKFLPPLYKDPAPGVHNGHYAAVFDMPKGRRRDEFYWEDISFFWRAALLGFKVWCAPWIKFHHIETRLVVEQMMMEQESPVPQ